MGATASAVAWDAVRTRSLLFIFGGVGALLASGYGVLFALLDEYRDQYGISESALGFVIGVGFLAGFVAQVTIAPHADRGHARRIVLIGIALGVAGLLMMAWAQAIVPLLAGRVVMGLGVGMATPAIRRIVILADPDRLGHNLGVLLAAEVGGFAAGPALSASMVGRFGIPSPFLTIAVATAAFVPFVVRTAVDEGSADEAPTQRFAFDLLRTPRFAAAVALGCGVWLMIGAFDSLWSVALKDLHASEWIANLGITLFALPLVVLAAPGGRLAQRVGPFTVGILGLTAAAGFMVAYGLVPTGGVMFAVAMVHGVTDGISISSTGVAVGQVVPRERQAGAQGVLGGLQTLAAGVSAPVIGAVYDHAGRRPAYLTSAAMMAAFVALGLGLLVIDRRRTGGAPGRARSIARTTSP